MKTFFLVACALLSIFGTFASAQNYAERASVTTGSGIVVKAWLDRSVVRLGEDIVVNFSLMNGSKRKIHVVSEQEPRYFVDTSEIVVLQPIPRYSVDFVYNFRFSTLPHGSVFKGKYVLPASLYKTDGLWSVSVGLAYVFDKDGLERARTTNNEDPLYLNGLLRHRAIGIQIGDLHIVVQKEEKKIGKKDWGSSMKLPL